MKKILKGKVSLSEKGFGFLMVENDDKDYFIPKNQAQRVFDGEIVEVEVVKYKDKEECVILNILKEKKEHIGKIIKGRSGFYVPLSNSNKILIDNYNDKSGNIVKFKITERATVNQKAKGEVTEILGHENSPKIENQIAIHKHEIPHIFNSKINKELESISEKIDYENRFDLTKLNFVTIDGDDSRDFDDAVYCEKTSFGWSLYVAIADVSHYVKPNTELDFEALERGNSVYFPNEVVPMLPEYLSNGLCSLNPNVERYALTVKMNINKNGTIKSFKFMNSVIESKARLTYEEVSSMLEDEDENIINKYSKVFKDLKEFEKLYEILKEGKSERGALEFEKRENKIKFDKENYKIEEVKFYKRKKSHKMIEEAMLCANICAAKLLTKLKIDAIYRVHEKPKDSKIETLKTMLQNIGLTLRGGDKTKSHHFRKMMDLAQNRDDKDFIHATLLKAMPKAVYRVQNSGHFGLAYDEYTHFTSPIRRYPDLIVHRAIKGLIASSEGDKYVQRREKGTGTQKDHYPYNVEDLTKISEQASMTERRADKASDEVFDSLKCHFLSNKVGEEFEGKIRHLTKTALFVEFDDFVLEGIVSYVDLPDYFTYIEEKGKIKGRRTKKEFKLGDHVSFKILKVNNETNKVYLTLNLK